MKNVTVNMTHRHIKCLLCTLGIQGTLLISKLIPSLKINLIPWGFEVNSP